MGGSKPPIGFSEPKQLGIDMNASNYGMPVPVVYGQNKVSGNCAWYGDFTVTQTQGGGKGGGGGPNSYDYKSSYMLVMCEGPITAFGNAWQGSSFQPLSNLQPAFTALGAIGQAPWSHFGTPQNLGYSGFAIIAFLNNDLGSQATTPNYQVEVNALQQFNPPSITDADPSAICTDVCTNVYHGIGFNFLGSLTQWHDYCVANSLFISPVYNTESTGASVLKDLCDWTNTQVYFSEGVLKFVPYGDVAVTGNSVTYTPNLTPAWNFTDADYVIAGNSPPVTLHRKALPDCSNTVRIEYPDRSYYYYDEMVEARDEEDAITNGVRAMSSKHIDSITTVAVARFVAQNILQRDLYIRNTYEWKTSWRFAYLEPSDPVTLTDSTMGFTQLLVRLTKVEEDEDGRLHFTAEELPIGVGHSANYNTQANGGATINTNVDPGPVDIPVFFRAPGFLTNQDSPAIGIALSGSTALWGAAQVNISYDGVNYEYKATIYNQARYGLMELPAWAASTVMAVGQLILDSNGNTQQVFASVSPFTTGATHPTWATSVGTHTTDNHVTWNCVATGGVCLPVGLDPDTVNLPQVTLEQGQLIGGTNAEADQLITLFMVDNELMSYGSATLISGETYQLGYLRRGTYGSVIVAHNNGATFVRLDDNIFYLPIDPSLVGQTIYVKFLSFNVFGKTPRTLSSETAYTYVIGTNTNLPDVPSTPSGLTVTAVPTGLMLNWSNLNPAAVGATTIQRSPDNSTWSVIGQVHGTGTTYIDPIGNGVYYYRIRSRGLLPQAGWSAFTAGVQQGVNVALVSGRFPPGQNLVNNGDFEAATFMVNGAPPGWVMPNAILAIQNPSTVAYNAVTPYQGTQSLLVTTNGATQGLMQAQSIPVTPGDFYSVTAALHISAAGMIATAGIFFANAAGTLVGAVDVAYSTTGAFALLTANGVVPATAVTGYLFFYNNSSTNGTIQLDVFTVIRQANPAATTDVTMRGSVPLTTLTSLLTYTAYAVSSTGPSLWAATHAYGFGTIIIDSNGNVQGCTESGTSGAAHPVWGTSVGVTVTEGTGGPIWICLLIAPSATQGCAIISAFGAQYLRADGTAGLIPTFLFYATNLAAGSTYYVYPAVNDLTGELLFYTDTTGAGGGQALYLNPLPAGGAGIDTNQSYNHCFYTTKSQATVSLQTRQGLVAVSSSGNFSVVIPATGSGGGSGGGYSGNCWHPMQEFDVEGFEFSTCAAQVGILERPDKVWTPDGWVQPTRHPATEEKEWRRVTYKADDGTIHNEIVTPAHCFIAAQGALIAAKDLALGKFLQCGSGGFVRVTGLEILDWTATPVKLEMPEPHLLCAYKQGGAVSHNPNQKP